MRARILGLSALLLAVVLAAGCADDVSPAARVGDTTISDRDLMDEVEQWAGNPAAFDQGQLQGLNPGTYPMRLVDVILQQRIDLELHRSEFEARDLELTDELRTTALAQLFNGDLDLARQALGGFDDAYAERYVDDIGRQVGLEDALGQEGYVRWRTAAYQDARIEVSPRYGEWDADAQSIVAPPGPTRPTTAVAP